MECTRCRGTGAERKCARCKAAYCGAQCQREDWKAGHKATCNPPTCYICLDNEDPEPVCAMGCACTRGDAGYAHVSCMIRAVDEQTKHDANPLRWMECFVCKHQFNGVLRNSLVEAYHAKNPDALISGKAIIMTMIHTSRERKAMKLASHYRDMCLAKGDQKSADVFELLNIEASIETKKVEFYKAAEPRLQALLERSEANFVAMRIRLFIAQTRLYLGTADLTTIETIDSVLTALENTTEMYWGVRMLGATARLLHGSRDIGLREMEEILKGVRRVFGANHAMYKSASHNWKIAQNGKALHDMAQKKIFPFIIRM